MRFICFILALLFQCICFLKALHDDWNLSASFLILSFNSAHSQDIEIAESDWIPKLNISRFYPKFDPSPPPPRLGGAILNFWAEGTWSVASNLIASYEKNWVWDRVISWLVKVAWNFLSIVPFKYGKETPSSRLDHHIHAKPFKKVSTV